MYSVSPKLSAFHGTYPENIDGILENNFYETKEKTWLGDGVYFFIEGIGALAPAVYAKQFAIDQAWDKASQMYSRTHYAVLQTTIKINDNKLLNLTIPEGNKLFNEFRDLHIANIAKIGKAIAGFYYDSDVLAEMQRVLGIEFVKSNLYIKFANQRITRFESKVPNVTVLVVRNPLKNIQKTTINLIEKGEIK
jgi:hypothetical protein